MLMFLKMILVSLSLLVFSMAKFTFKDITDFIGITSEEPKFTNLPYNPKDAQDPVTLPGKPGDKAEFVKLSEDTNYFKSTLLPSVFKKEGGYSTDKSDKGNYLKKDINSEFIGTNHGISADILAKYRDKSITAEDMKNLTVEEAKNIYEKEFYTSKGIDKLPKDLQEIVFHGVVNSGGHAISVVQGLLGLKQDGIVGPKTMEAMTNAKFTKQEFKDALLNKYKTFDTWKKHGQGWTNRFEDLAR